MFDTKCSGKLLLSVHPLKIVSFQFLRKKSTWTQSGHFKRKKFYSKNSEEKNIKFKEVKNKIKEYQKFIKNNFEFVGKNFAYEARSIHYNSKKNNKGIYGTATKEEIKELKEEGVKTEIIPWLEDKSN